MQLKAQTAGMNDENAQKNRSSLFIFLIYNMLFNAKCSGCLKERHKKKCEEARHDIEVFFCFILSRHFSKVCGNATNLNSRCHQHLIFIHCRGMEFGLFRWRAIFFGDFFPCCSRRVSVFTRTRLSNSTIVNTFWCVCVARRVQVSL